jgi:hypothetical protein
VTPLARISDDLPVAHGQPRGPARRRDPDSGLIRAVAAAGRWLTGIYRLDLGLRAEQFVVSPEDARSLLPHGAPRSGVLVLDEGPELCLGLYVDPRDQGDPDAVVEETSHLLCLAWHAAHGRRVSRLTLELQGEVDRYAVARLQGRDGFGHFEGFVWADWMDPGIRRLYATAHRAALRYCRLLTRRFPRRRDTPALLSELRCFYRASPEQKLRAAN